MKKRFLAFFTAVLLVFAALSCSALAYDVEAEQREVFGADELEQSLPEEAYAAFGSLTLRDAAHPESQLEKLWMYLTGSSQDMLVSAVRNAALLLVIVFLTALCAAVTENSACGAVTQMAGAVAVAALSAEHISSCISVGCEALWSLSDFSKVLLPSMCAAASASGAFTAASAKYAATTLFFDGLLSLETKILLPMLYAYAALMIGGHTLQNDTLLSVASLIKRIFKVFLVAVATIFTFYLSVTGVLTGTADETAAKAAKTAVSSTLPVVGSIVSDAASTVLSGAAMLRNGIGIIGLLGVLSVCTLPYLTLGVHYLLYKLAAGIACTFTDKRIGNLIGGFGDLYAFLLGMTGVASFILFLSIVSSMKAVNLG